ADFDRLLVGALEPTASTDRGASRLLQQTVFLTETFTRFETAVRATGLADEHALRGLALDSTVPLYRPPIVTGGDQAADRHGLWTADFDLLARLPHLDRLDIAITETLLATGLHERLHDLLPGIDEERIEAASIAPVLIVPDTKGAQEQPRVFVFRDREE